MSSQPASQSPGLGKPYVRAAKPEELGSAAEVARRAFIKDPFCNYIGSVQEMLQLDVDNAGSRNLKVFLAFLLQAGREVGGRLMVAVIPEGRSGSSSSPSDEHHEKIVGVALWLPPNRRLSLWKVYTLIRGGVFGVVKRWGLAALQRFGVEFADVSYAAMLSGYKEKGVLKESPGAAWYLQLVLTDPEHQGTGILSLLMREAYAYAPNAIFTLESTSMKSRDRYAHLGFKLIKPIILGAGKVNRSGLPASKEDAVGVECYVMINWNGRE